MGADSTLVFYGLRFATDANESGGLQDYSDARVVLAREHNLAHWWGSFSVDHINEQEYLFIGTLMGNVGIEGVYEVSPRDDELHATMKATRDKLSKAGFVGEPRLYIQFEPDY